MHIADYRDFRLALPLTQRIIAATLLPGRETGETYQDKGCTEEKSAYILEARHDNCFLNSPKLRALSDISKQTARNFYPQIARSTHNGARRPPIIPPEQRTGACGKSMAAMGKGARRPPIYLPYSKTKLRARVRSRARRAVRAARSGNVCSGRRGARKSMSMVQP